MPHLQFYADERERWPQLHQSGYSSNEVGRDGYKVRHRYYVHGRMDRPEILAGIQRLASRFGLSLKGLEIGWTSGRRTSAAGRNHATFNLDWCDWLTVVHELAHVYWFRKLAYGTRQGRNKHGRRMAGIVDRMAAWVVEQGWHLGTLAHEVALAELELEARHQEREKLAAMPEPIEARIARREEQVKRLERKIKALTTRLRTAHRSLGALQRSAKKRSEPCSS
jgi:hypothetical protein